MSQVRIAAAAIQTAITSIEKIGITLAWRSVRVADAMGQRVIRTHGSRRALRAAGREQQTVVNFRVPPPTSN